MAFISLCTALYDYRPQSDGELAIQEGELVYILEKGTEDDWWKARKRAVGEDEEEPVGLIPNNYVQEAAPSHRAKALYDYTRQTDEELSFSEDAQLGVYDISDPDWTLVGFNGEFGFVPANYIEIIGEVEPKSPESALTPQSPVRLLELEQPASPASTGPSSSGPAAALAGVMSSKTTASPTTQTTQRPIGSPPPNISLTPRPQQYTPEDSEEERPLQPVPSLPQRPPSQQLSPPPTQYASPRSPDSDGVVASPPYNRAVSQTYGGQGSQRSQGGFHLYNINEMVSAIGKKKKLPTTLGLNLATGIVMIAPEKSRDGPQQEWTAEKLTHYSIEGKHVFMELVRPSKSVDLHAGAKDTAQEIIAGLGEIAGAARAEGLREILEISESGQKKGKMLYEFMAQGEDEVAVAVDDEVIILDDARSEEWWMVRRIKNGKEGVVPSSYVEITKTVTAPGTGSLNPARSIVEHNRLEEERLAKEASKSSRKRGGSDPKSSEVGPGLKLPVRGSSLTSGTDGNTSSSQRSKRDSKAESKASSKSRPDTKRVRTWTDRSGSFKVEAQFLGLKDGKIHLHKSNGIKIAVPVAKMAIEDIEYVEKVTGQSLDDEKPLSEIRRRSTQKGKTEPLKRGQPSTSAQQSGATIEQTKRPSPRPADPSKYDWFDFFLNAGVSPYQCERYTFNFNKDSMDESNLSDITPEVLRTLGLKEGDILRVMKYLDNKLGRKKGGSGESDGPLPPNDIGGGLFSGPGGTLRNNTRKGRPAPAVQSNDVVDAKSFRQKTNEKVPQDRSESVSTPLASVPPPPPSKTAGGFDDDAWDVKPSRQQPTAVATSQAPMVRPSTSTAAPPPALTGSMAELSLLSSPLEPTKAPKPAPQPPLQPPQTLPLQQPQEQMQPTQQSAQARQPTGMQQQPTGANPGFFSQLNQQQTGAQVQQQQAPQAPHMPVYNPQPNFQQQQPLQNMPPRQRPQAPSAPPQNSFLPPPPRPLSAPQNAPQNNTFGPPPLQPQLTGFQPNHTQSQMAPSGQSLDELNQLNQMRLQQQQQLNQQQQMYPQPTGFGQQKQSLGQFGGGIQPQSFQASPQPTNFQNQQPYINGQQTGSPFADLRPQQQTSGFQQMAPQPTGFQPQFQSSLQPQQAGSINSILPSALQPQPTGINGSAFGQHPPPMPQQQPSLAPLQPQKTGPAPSVSFGTAAKKLAPQPTGRRANLSQATPQNPFGF